VDAPLDVCIARDTKGLYAKAMAGEIPNFTGISDPYEVPETPDLHIRTDQETPEQSAVRVLGLLSARGFLPPA
jgi:adenylylsulfate kinase-like enzyme